MCNSIYLYINHDFQIIYSSTVELEKLVKMKRERESRSEEKVGDRGSNEDGEVEMNQKTHSSISSISSPVDPVLSPMSPV